MELRFPVRSRQVIGSGVQLLLRTIVHLPHLAGENIAEYKVGGLQHLRPGAEVALEQYLPGLTGRGICRVKVALILLQKNLRLCQAEAIDALLDITHSEKVLPFTGDSGKNTVLHLVGVLIFVHHDLRIPLGDLHGQLRGLFSRI